MEHMPNFQHDYSLGDHPSNFKILSVEPLNSLRCKDTRFDTRIPNGWCPHASTLRMNDPEALKYFDGRCVNWLRL